VCSSKCVSRIIVAIVSRVAPCGTWVSPLSAAEVAADELTRRGMKVIGQLGMSRYRIDLVAMHPQQPGRYVLAIECDGASYHSAQTARDRDRLRQQQLEALGWRFHRICSTDWFLRRTSANAVEWVEAEGMSRIHSKVGDIAV